MSFDNPWSFGGEKGQTCFCDMKNALAPDSLLLFSCKGVCKLQRSTKLGLYQIMSSKHLEPEAQKITVFDTARGHDVRC